MARLIVQSIRGETRLLNFPAQWIPMFVHFGAEWAEPSPAAMYIPILSEVSIETLLTMISAAQAGGRLRVMVEGIAALDPLVADVLHRLDRKLVGKLELIERDIPFTGWQSYGRREILDFSRRVARVASAIAPVAVLLPCARKRPYGLSKTYKRLASGLSDLVKQPFDKIVISSLGVVPLEFWNDPVVLAYNSGVPDIYRVLRLMREFFGVVRYECVVDCLEFEPYRDCLRIIKCEGLIGRILEGPARKVKRLPFP